METLTDICLCNVRYFLPSETAGKGTGQLGHLQGPAQSSTLSLKAATGTDMGQDTDKPLAWGAPHLWLQL